MAALICVLAALLFVPYCCVVGHTTKISLKNTKPHGERPWKTEYG